MIYNFWFGVIDEDSDLCGEEFIVEVDAGYENDPLALAWDIAAENFGDVKMKCYGCISAFEAEMMGLDTY